MFDKCMIWREENKVDTIT